MLILQPNQCIKFTYTNWQGETAERSCLVQEVMFGETDYHPTPQFLLKGLDLDRGAERIYAMSDIKNLTAAPMPSLEGLIGLHYPEQKALFASKQYRLAERVLELQMSTDWGQDGMATKLGIPLKEYLVFENGTLEYGVNEYGILIDHIEKLIAGNAEHG